MSELRPSFEERDRYLDLLSQSYANGRLDDEEFARRSQGVLGAVTHRDALAYFEGLPEPNIVPVEAPPPPQPRSTAHQPVVAPRPQRQSGDLTRRTLIAAGAGVGLLGLLGVFSLTPGSDDGGPYPDGVMPVDELTLSMDGIFVDGVQGAAASLAEQGLTEVEEFHVTRELIWGRAAPAGGGEVFEFTQEPRSSLSAAAASQSASQTLAVDRLAALVPVAIEASADQLFGDITDVELRWDEAGEPLVRVAATDGHRRGLVDVSESGDVVYQEEYQ